MKKLLFISAAKNELNSITNLARNKLINSYELYFETIGIGLIHSIYNYNKIFSLYKPDLVIYTGICGALNSNLKTGDIFIPEKSVLIDNGYFYDDSKLEYGNIVNYPDLKCNDENIINHFTNHNCFTGIIGSSNIPVFSKSKRIELNSKLGLDIIDMETFSVAYISNIYKIKIFTVKSVSDTINDNLNNRITSNKDFYKTLNIKESLEGLKIFFKNNLETVVKLLGASQFAPT